MSYRPSNTRQSRGSSAYDLQSRYVDQLDYSSTSPPPPQSPSHPAFLREQQAHARYSSADLYALDQEAYERGRGEEHVLMREEERGRASDGDEDDDGAGFASYGDFGAAAKRRSSVQLVQTQSFKPAMVSHPSGFSTRSNLDPAYSKPAASASTTKFPTTPASELVDAPILSPADWMPGEAMREKEERNAEKKRVKRDRVVGDVKAAGRGAGGWVRRNWKWLVPLFVFLAVAAILLCYFLVPRTPTITFNSSKIPDLALTSNDPSPYVSSEDPTSFSFGANLTLAIDSSASYLPVHYRSFAITVRLQETDGVVASQKWDAGEISVRPKRVTSYQFPIEFYGNYSSSSNPTYQIIRSSCAHIYPTTYRAPLNLTVTVSSEIIGVVGTKERSARLDAVECPVQWSGTAS
ncbi:hypothetical protein Rt10032_c11g4398 [Rhodotorula toruloides]|uniref:Uncharacterized protein n=1 Tax=Rhodotorula toruloides TaxID=5286 RepID=A0A511KJ25_RHOTO|nr:hypothetical protein Rt10032_c11g4398 [Rhodotorula toruloides]